MKIALTHTGNPQKHQYYLDWLKANEDVKIVELSVDDNNLNELNSCDALVLSGGVDVHPKFYGSKTGYPGAPEKFNEKRDEFEIAAFQLARENNIPVLGICRGMQLINVIHKGTLIQNHEDENLSEMHKGNPDKSHHISIGKETLLHNITGQTNGEINSAHHQAIDRLGEGLIINAKADDGTIEGVELANQSNKPFLLGIQWHPERMFKFRLEDSPLSKAIRDRFIEEVKKSIVKKNEDH
jgi:putative glutamine amidotransferase